MKCFNHQEIDAVGICKSCGKGVCPECAVDLGKGLACRNRCEANVKALIGLIESNIKMSPRAEKMMASSRGQRAGAAIFILVLGAMFCLWGISDPSRFMFIIMLGGCFLIYGTFTLIQSGKTEKQKKKETPPDVS